MVKIYMRKTLDALHPADDFQRDIFDKVTDGKLVQAEITQPRNIQFHRLFFAMLNLAWKNQTHYQTVDAFRAAITVHLGHCDFVAGKDDKLIAVPRSISFAKMDELEFRNFFDHAADTICQTMLNGTETESFRNELESMLS